MRLPAFWALLEVRNLLSNSWPPEGMLNLASSEGLKPGFNFSAWLNTEAIMSADLAISSAVITRGGDNLMKSIIDQ